MRSKYIYLIYVNGSHLLSVHTVKHEAHRWLERSRWSPRMTTLCRMQDGVGDEWHSKKATRIDWDPELFDLDDLDPLDRIGIQATSTMADWPEWTKGLLR